MAEKLLSAKAVENAKPTGVVRYLNDGNGLRLQIRPDGRRYWMLRYKLDGKESTYLLGTADTLGLAEARDRAQEARELVRQGRSPSVERKVGKAAQIAADKATFRVVSEEWLERNRPNWSAHHHERNAGLLRRILLPTLGDIPVADITEAALLRPLLAAYDGGIKESARRARAVAAQVFRYAKDTHRATHNPALELRDSSLMPPVQQKHFAALPSDQVGSMLKKLDASRTSPVVKAAIRLMLYTGLRDYSLRSARWSEVNLNASIWTVPGERMKSGRVHSVPLPRQAVEILTDLQNLTGRTGFVFASYGKEGHLAENTLRITLHRLGFPVTAHGTRSLLTDLLNRHNFNADAVERQMDHVEANAVRRAYLRDDFAEHRRAMMQWVADWMDAEQSGTVLPAMPDNVVALRRVV